MGEKLIIDGHMHCGPRKIVGVGGFNIDAERIDRGLWNPFERVKKNLAEIDVKGAVLFPFAEDIYREPIATKESREKAHDYLLDIAKQNEYFFAFYFVWNDFVVPDCLSDFKGIKWHRHFWSDPEYDYRDAKCDKFVEAICKYDLPVILEDSFDNTKIFCSKYPEVKVIIPHVGLANGGARDIIPAFKNNPNVFIETSLAYPFQIIEALHQFGPERIIFGSDTPYSSTKIELFNLLEYDLLKHFNEEDVGKMLATNMLRLMHIPC